ncbi:unnamed protein product [Polarella glacialis]|uniref:Protein-serine/threonine phosphatase n=1 Tax=Polarella glacialis TaxID=89957 RepID=A0A813H0M3_POLGL|nr:unnamed protein product [Polarella glacialis]
MPGPSDCAFAEPQQRLLHQSLWFGAMTYAWAQPRTDMHEVQPNLWLGSLRASQDSEALAERGVTHVLSVGECNLGARQRMRLQPTEADPLERLLVAVPDESSSRLDRHFTACSSFISEGLKNGGSVLVHCFAGQSRSPTLVAAHLMCVEGWTAAVALEFVQRRRPSVHPNAGFLSQLLSLEGRLRIEGRLGVKTESWSEKCRRSHETQRSLRKPRIRSLRRKVGKLRTQSRLRRPTRGRRQQSQSTRLFQWRRSLALIRSVPGIHVRGASGSLPHVASTFTPCLASWAWPHPFGGGDCPERLPKGKATQLLRCT